MVYTQQDKIDFVKEIIPQAKKIHNETGLSCGLMIAQAVQETGWGENILENTNNLFNIKADLSWMGKTKTFRVDEFINGKWIKQDSKFRVYDSYEDSFKDRVNFFRTNSRYNQLFTKDILGDLTKEAQTLQKVGYATDPNYTNALKNVLNGKTMQKAIQELGYNMDEKECYKETEQLTSKNTTQETITIPNFSYPFKKSNELEYFTNSSKEGNYLFNKDGFWHGGVHFIEEEISTLNDGDSKAIKCIADGEIVAYRINDKYLKNDGETDLERGLYSTGFFLVRHKIEYPKDNKLTFFSLYMHTAKKDEYLKLPKVVKHDLIGINTPVNSVNILQMPFKVQAGEIIAIAGLYNTDESKDLECLHLEVFADEKIEEFINKAQIYYQSDASPNKPKAKNLEVPANIKKYKDQNYTLVKLIKNANIREGFSNTSATYQNSPTPRGTSVFIDKNTKTQVGEHLRYKVLKIGETDVSSQNLTIADITFEIKRDTNAYAENGIVEQKLNLVNVEKKVGANGITYVKIDNDNYVMQKDCIEIHPVTFSWARVFKNVTQDKVSIFKDLKKVLNGEESEFTDGFRDLCLNIDKDDHRGVLSAMEIEEATQNEEVKKLTSKYIVSHPNEWKYEESKWGQIKEMLEDEEDKKHIENEQKRIEKFSLFEECKSIQDFPEDANKVYHINPIGLIGEFGVSKCGINVDKFIEEYKKIHTIYDSRTQTYLKINLNQSSENGLKKLVLDLKAYFSEKNSCNIYHFAYMLATVKLESYDYLRGLLFNPISELGGDRYAEREYDPILGKDESRRRVARNLGNTERGDGIKYKGRGFVQITGKSNYLEFKNTLGIDLITNPDLALDWNNAFKIMVIGMEKGKFRGYKLNDYLNSNKKDYLNARNIINARLDKAEIIKKYAEEFETCLELSK